MKAVMDRAGASKSTRRNATVTISAPLAASASAINSGLANLPVPTIRRDWNVRVPMVSRSVNGESSKAVGGDCVVLPLKENLFFAQHFNASHCLNELR